MVYFLICAVIIIADFITKRWAENVLTKIDTIPLWENVFHLTYVENRGAAFGILQNQRVIFIILTFLILAAVLYVAVKYKHKPFMLNLGLSFIVSGAIGNMIDRIWLGYVVDFLDFRLINFPVFNTADIFVCIGAVLTAVFFIIYDDGKKNADDKKGCEKNGD